MSMLRNAGEIVVDLVLAAYCSAEIVIAKSENRAVNAEAKAVRAEAASRAAQEQLQRMSNELQELRERTSSAPPANPPPPSYPGH